MTDRSALADGHTTPLMDLVRVELARVARAGDPQPGRRVLAQKLGASEHEVREALKDLKREAKLLSAGDRRVTRDGPAGARLVAWTGFAFGSLVSVAANVLASHIPPVGAPVGWHPSIWAQFGAAVWPLGLLLSVEALARIRWPKSWLWSLARFGGAGTVALGSAVISYAHIAAVLSSWNYSQLGAHVGPLVIDGLMTISGFALLAISTHTAPTDTDDNPAT